MGATHMGMEAARREPGFATGLTLLVPITLSTMAIVLLAPILPQLQAEFAGIPGAEYLAPMVLTTPALCVALLSPFAGMLGDRFGRRPLLIASLLAYAMLGVAPLWLTDLKTIIASRVAVGVSEALIMVLSTAMIGDYFSGERRDRWLAAQTATASLSALLFFNVGGYLGRFGWRTPFWVYVSAIVMLLAVLRFTWPTADKIELAGGGRQPGWQDFPWARMGGIIAVTVYGSVFFYTVQIQASNGLALLGLHDPARIGFLTSVASLGVPLGTFIYSRLTTVPVRHLLFIEFAILSLGFMCMSKASGATAFLIGCGINQIGAGLLLPTLLVWAMNQLHFEIRGRGAGLWTGAFALGQFLSPIAVTFFALRVGGLLPAFAVLGGAALAAMVMTLFAGVFMSKTGVKHA